MNAARRSQFLEIPRGVEIPAPARVKTNGNAKPQFCAFIPPVEQVITPTSKHCVITIGVGKMRDMLRCSRPFMESYARKIGADFLAITNGTQTWPMAEKFRLMEIGKHYERILFVDADVLIRPSAPNIFAIVPRGAIAAHDDIYFIDSGVGKFTDASWIEKEQRDLGISQDVKLERACINSGVVVFDGRDSDIWKAPAKPFPLAHTMEQNWVQYNILSKKKLFRLPGEWNHQWWMDPEFRHIDSAHFVHLAGLGQLNSDMLLPMMRALCLR